MVDAAPEYKKKHGFSVINLSPGAVSTSRLIMSLMCFIGTASHRSGELHNELQEKN